MDNHRFFESTYESDRVPVLVRVYAAARDCRTSYPCTLDDNDYVPATQDFGAPVSDDLPI